MDPNEQTAARYRLFSRAIKANGTAQLPVLQPYLLTAIQKIDTRYIESQDPVDGMILACLLNLELTVVRMEIRETSSSHERDGDRTAGSLLLWNKTLSVILPIKSTYTLTRS